MKKFLVLGMLFVFPGVSLAASTDYYLKIDTIEGEANSSAGSSTSSPKGNVEFEWKVEEGEKSTEGDPDRAVTTGSVPNDGVEPDEIDFDESDDDNSTANTGVEPEEIDFDSALKNTGIEPDEIDFQGDSENATNFSILLSGGSDDSDEAQEGRDHAAQILFDTVHQEQGDEVPMEELSLNYGKIKTKVKQKVKLFGFIPVTTKADVEVDAAGRVKVKYPWWAFLVGGKDEQGVGERVFGSLSKALELQHEAVKNAINNIR